jgi:hypothetical protein
VLIYFLLGLLKFANGACLREERLSEFENRVLRRIFRPKREDVAGEGWRRLHNEELHNLYASSYVLRVIKSRRMRWAEIVTRMGGIRNTYRTPKT